MYLRECVLTDHVPSVARVGCTEGSCGEMGSMLGSCLYRARERWALCWARVCIEPDGAVLMCTRHHMRTTVADKPRARL